MDKKTALLKAEKLGMDPVDFLLLLAEIKKSTKSIADIEKTAAFTAERSRKVGCHIVGSDPFEELYLLYQHAVALSCVLEPDANKRAQAAISKCASMLAS